MSWHSNKTIFIKHFLKTKQKKNHAWEIQFFHTSWTQIHSLWPRGHTHTQQLLSGQCPLEGDTPSQTLSGQPVSCCCVCVGTPGGSKQRAPPGWITEQWCTKQGDHLGSIRGFPLGCTRLFFHYMLNDITQCYLTWDQHVGGVRGWLTG